MLKRIWVALGHFRVAYFFAGAEFVVLLNHGRISWAAAVMLGLVVVLLLSGWRNEKIGRIPVHVITEAGAFEGHLDPKTAAADRTMVLQAKEKRHDDMLELLEPHVHFNGGTLSNDPCEALQQLLDAYQGHTLKTEAGEKTCQ